MSGLREQPDEPELTSLVVYATSGKVGPGYGAVAAAVAADASVDIQDVAARERLACYRFFGATDLPADGGHPAQGQPDAKRQAQVARQAAVVPDRPKCPRCGGWKGLGMPICDACSEG